MKTTRPRYCRLRCGCCVAVLVGCLTASLVAAQGAQPKVQPLLPSAWPTWPRGDAYDVEVVGNYAYVALHESGLGVFDVSNPTKCVRVGGFDTRGTAIGVAAVSGNYAYVAEERAGLQVIDVSDPANCVRVGGYDTSGLARGVAVVADRIYLVASERGLLVLPNVQFTVRVDATPGAPFSIEAATELRTPINWTPLLTTNVPAMPFDYVDFDVKISKKPQKFYRVRQP